MAALGMYLGEIHSYHDLDLVLSRVEIPPAQPKLNFVDVPGRDGALDQSEAHGGIKFHERTGKFTFSMNPSGDLSEESWEIKKTEISNIVNGKRLKLTLDKDPDYYYIGRCSVDEYLSDKRHRQIVVSAQLHPYKFKQQETVATYALALEEKTVTLTNARKSVVPTIACTKSAKIQFGGNTFNVGAGSFKYLDIRFVMGRNVLTISGEGTLTISYQEADL